MLPLTVLEASYCISNQPEIEAMDKSKLYREKVQAQIDEWTADLKKLKAKARGEGADAGLEIQSMVENLESKFREGKARLKAAWESEKQEEVV